MHPVLERVKHELGDKIRIIKIDVDKHQQTAYQYGIRSVPTLMIFKNGKILWRQSGSMTEANLINVLTPYLQ